MVNHANVAKGHLAKQSFACAKKNERSAMIFVNVTYPNVVTEYNT